MTATEAQVAAAMESLRVHEAWPPHFLTCDCGLGFKVYSEMRTHLAQVVADAVVAAGPDPATIAALEAAIDRVRRRHPRGDEEAGTLAPGLWCPGCGQERSRNGYGGCPDRNALTEPRP